MPIRVSGLTELQRDLRRARKDIAKELRVELRAVGDVVKDDAMRRFSGIDAKSAAGYRTVVRARGVAVEQRLGRTTGTRPDFGALQMRRALLPSLEAKSETLEDRLGEMFDRFGSRQGF